MMFSYELNLPVGSFGCFLQDFKDYSDAENIMPLATSDFRAPVCQELRSLRSASGMELLGGAFSSGFPFDFNLKTSPLQTQEVSNNVVTKDNNKMYNEHGSVDSSDTYASCQTHLFHSQVCIRLIDRELVVQWIFMISG